MASVHIYGNEYNNIIRITATPGGNPYEVSGGYYTVDGVLGSTFGPSDLFFIEGNGGNDTIVGSEITDQIYGGSGIDQIYAGGGDDHLVLQFENFESGEIYDGGAGFDTLSLPNFINDSTFDLREVDLRSIEKWHLPTAMFAGDKRVVVLAEHVDSSRTSLERVQGNGFANVLEVHMDEMTTLSISTFVAMGFSIRSSYIKILGDADAETINGTYVKDVIFGGGGADTITGGANADVLEGGDGNDLFLIANFADHAVAEQIIGGNDIDELRFTGKMAGTLLLGAGVDVEQVVIGTGTAAAAVLTGTTAINVDGTALRQSVTLIGNAGANGLTGGAGNDLLNGGLGNDTLVGGAGNDIYMVSSTGDRVFETTTITSTVDAGGMDTVQSSVTFSLDTSAGVRFVENLTLTGTGNITGTGNALANILTGNTGNNLLRGGGGNDTINGGVGNDTMVGGAGNDIYLVTSTGDRVFETTTTTGTRNAGGIDTVQSSVTFSLDSSAGVRFVENLTLTGTGNINGTGNALANTIVGNSGANQIDGGSGNDTLTGGSGSDSFVFITALGSGNVDEITDFNVLADTIRLENSIFIGLAGGTLVASAFALNRSGDATDASDRIIYESDTGNLYFDRDGNGAAAKVHFATLDTGLTLTNADFFVF